VIPLAHSRPLAPFFHPGASCSWSSSSVQTRGEERQVRAHRPGHPAPSEEAPPAAPDPGEPTVRLPGRGVHGPRALRGAAGRT